MKSIELFLEKVKSYQAPMVCESGFIEVGRFHPDKDGLLKGGWLHGIHAPISNEKIKNMEKRIGKTFPNDLFMFYQHVNGLGLFCASIVIMGSLECKRQPVSIEYQNTIDLPLNKDGNPVSDFDHIYIGGYSKDGSCIKINIDTGKVVREPRDKWGVVLNSWSSLVEFLEMEFNRMSDYYKKIDGEISMLDTIPPPDPD